MNGTLRSFGPILARTLVRALIIAVYVTAAFAIAPAMSSGAEISNAAMGGSMTDGILIALGLMIVTIGTAVARWIRDEPAA